MTEIDTVRLGADAQALRKQDPSMAARVAAAADELDRLRGFERSAESWFHKAMQARAERNALRAENHRLSDMFMRAPHAEFCKVMSSFGVVQVDSSAMRCTCWKADAL